MCGVCVVGGGYQLSQTCNSLCSPFVDAKGGKKKSGSPAVGTQGLKVEHLLRISSGSIF